MSFKYSVKSSFVKLLSFWPYRSTLLCSFIMFVVHSKSLHQITLLNRCERFLTRASNNFICLYITELLIHFVFNHRDDDANGINNNNNGYSDFIIILNVHFFIPNT